MKDLNDSAYYRARAAKARASAEGATDPTIAKIHGEMAESYDLLADQSALNEKKLA